jgi:HPt (histidine-containing phosphotransfer) domain-containing protein
LADLIALFHDTYPELLAAVRAAVANKDGEQLRIAAHTLKGSVGVFDATAAYDLARRLEEVGRGQNWDEARATLAELEDAVANLQQTLCQLRPTGVSTG